MFEVSDAGAARRRGLGGGEAEEEEERAAAAFPHDRAEGGPRWRPRAASSRLQSCAKECLV